MKPLSIVPVRTPIFSAGADLTAFIVNSVPPELVEEKMILAVTSKIVSLSENRLVAKNSVDKKTLVEREADLSLGEIGYGTILTIKEGLFIASSGIDESNSENGDFILYPAEPFTSAENLWRSLRVSFGLKNMGILLTDSKTSPLRLGVTGVALAHWGFTGLVSKIGQTDLFDRALQMTKINYADGLASAATLVMGEGNESRPIAVISGAEVDFGEITDPNELKVTLTDDLYYPFFRPFLRP